MTTATKAEEKAESVWLYTDVCRLTGILFFLLSATLMFSPGVIFQLLSLDGHADTAVLARRASCLFLGLGILVFGLRTSPHEDVQRIVSVGVMFLMGAVACAGIVELFFGRVGPGVLIAVIVEAVIAVSYARYFLIIRRAAKHR